MKKIITLTLLLALSFSVYAQKSFIFVRAESWIDTKYNINLSGDLPSNMRKYYGQKEISEVLNALSKNGYDLDSFHTEADNRLVFLFSKGENNSSANEIRRIKTDDNSDVYEVARYNLQGCPIKENEKGTQIVVYSNYTAKTIIVE